MLPITFKNVYKAYTLMTISISHNTQGENFLITYFNSLNEIVGQCCYITCTDLKQKKKTKTNNYLINYVSIGYSIYIYTVQQNKRQSINQIIIYVNCNIQFLKQVLLSRLYSLKRRINQIIFNHHFVSLRCSVKSRSSCRCLNTLILSISQ